MNSSEILKASGFTSAELTGGTLVVHTPIDGSEIASLKTHSTDDVLHMIGKGVDAFSA